MLCTRPLSPPNPGTTQVFDEVDQRATFPPEPVGASKSPPTQTWELSSSQNRVLTSPDRPPLKAVTELSARAIDATLLAEMPERDSKTPPIYKVPLLADPSLDQQSALMIPPGLVVTNARNRPSGVRWTNVSPSDEKVGLLIADEAKGESVDHQSRPENDPPSATVPIFEKSTWGRDAGAVVEATTVIEETWMNDNRRDEMDIGRGDVGNMATPVALVKI